MQADDSGICLLAWKRRSGWAAASNLLSTVLPTTRRRKQQSQQQQEPQNQQQPQQQHQSLWEERWIVVCTQSGELRYYAVDQEQQDSSVARGCVDLIRERPQITVVSKPSSDAPTVHELEISVTEAAAMTAISSSSSSTTTATTPTSNKQWRFCFHTQQDLMQFLQVTHRVQDAAGQYDVHPHTLHTSWNDDCTEFEHALHASDHVYRWEMICCPPVIYPIQIHGIVLDAGRNCVVLADFGLTGYTTKKDGGQQSEFNHQGGGPADAAEDSNQLSHHAAILEAYYNKLLRPSNHQRLNIVTLTDPYEIRKWTKANYDDAHWGSIGASSTSSGAKQLAKLSKFLSKLSTPATTKKSSKTTKSSRNSKPSSNDAEDDDDDDHTEGDLSQSQSREYEDDDDEEASSSLYQVQSQSMDSSESSATQRQRNNSNKKEPLPLPRSDPVPIVLARANFLLEHEDQVPPYHVLYSNSECLAVWCKTGRWSTLQTAVFLSTNAVGGAKSATLATLGVAAAAHALLAPVVAVGGLIWVSTPLWLLQKARHKWHAATEQMNRSFWAQAEPRVFVAAIEHWSGMTLTTTTATTTAATTTTTASSLTTATTAASYSAVVAAQEEKSNDFRVENDDSNKIDGEEHVDEKPSET